MLLPKYEELRCMHRRSNATDVAFTLDVCLYDCINFVTLPRTVKIVLFVAAKSTAACMPDIVGATNISARLCMT